MRIFCASTVHNSDDSIFIPHGYFKNDVVDSIPYTFLKTPQYKGNGKARILNMISFYRNIRRVSKELMQKGECPDIILASSVHPLTLIAGIKTAIKNNIPCICEIRDLWPESLVAYNVISRRNIITKSMYNAKKWIYKKANAIIFTMPNGKDCIYDHGWEKSIDLNKVYYINNGVDLETFEYNKNNWTLQDDDLDNEEKIKVLYSGSIRYANDVSYIMKAAEHLQSDERFIFIIYGDGEELPFLKKIQQEKSLNNVVFKGRVEKKYIPFIVSKGDLNLITGKANAELTRYGLSLNKLFEYMAGGKPVLTTLEEGSIKIIDNHEKPVGITCSGNDSKEFAKMIVDIVENKQKYNELCQNAKTMSKEFDFSTHTDRLIEIIERLTTKNNSRK